MIFAFWRGWGGALALAVILGGVGIALLVKQLAGITAASGPVFTIFIGSGLLLGAGLLVAFDRLVVPRFADQRRPPLSPANWKPPQHSFLGIPLRWLWIVPGALGLFLVVGSTFALR